MTRISDRYPWRGNLSDIMLAAWRTDPRYRREWEGYRVKNLLAQETYARNRDTIDYRYGDAATLAEAS